MAPLLTVILIASVVCAFVWIASLISKTNSWVDQLWSIAPVIYVWVFAGFAGLSDGRLNLMAILVTLWGARLTFNFARKGGYTGEEDYRWPVLRARMKPWQFQLFNLLFITLYQNAILVLITLPAFTAFEHRDSPLGVWDWVLAAAFLLFLAGETIADQQQWVFHRQKAKVVAGGGVPPKRFLTTGLWQWSRHPNFFFEQAQWWVVFLFGALAAGSLLQWTVLGAALLTALFVGSTIFTESITRSKYPEYAQYQATTSPIIPWFPRRGPKGAETAQAR
jgi:steroid 5-alpha reductase family enzyme